MQQAAAAEGAGLSSILVLQLCPIGDTLFGTPAIRALRHRFPDARIAVVTWAANRDVLAGNPRVDRLILVKSALRLPQVLSELAEERFDAVVGLSNIGSWLTLFSSASVRVGFNSQTLGWHYTASVPDRRERHAVDYCLDVVAALGAEPRGRQPEIFLSEADHRWAAQFLGVGAQEPEPPLRVALHPGGRHFPAKRWTISGFAYVADYVAGQYGAQVVIVGGRDDVALAEAICDQCRLAEPLVAAGRATLKMTAAVIERCDLFVGNDSAPLHLATAVGTPVVALFGPTSVDNFRPLGPLDVVVRHDPGCSPCFRWLGGSMQHLTTLRTLECNAECMRRLSPEMVVAAIEQQLDRLNLRAARGLERPARPVLPMVTSAFAALRRPPRLRRARAERPRAALLAGRRSVMPHKVQEFDEL